MARLPDRPPVKPPEPAADSVPRAASPPPRPPILSAGEPLTPRVTTAGASEPASVAERPAARAAAAPRGEPRPAPAPSSETASRAKLSVPLAEWDAPPAPRAGGARIAIGATAALLAVCAAGYFGYTRYLQAPPSPTAESATDDDANRAALAQASGDDDTDAGVPALDDPFADETDSLPDAVPPRQLRHADDAHPIARAGGQPPRIRPKKTVAVNDEPELSLDLPEAADEPAAQQSEPESDDDSPPPLRAPRLSRPAGSRPGAAADPFEGYDAASDRESRGSRRGTDGPAISIMEVADEQEAEEQLDGFEADDEAPRRATSRTTVLRAANAPPPPPADDEDDWTIDESRESGRGRSDSEPKRLAADPDEEDALSSEEPVTPFSARPRALNGEPRPTASPRSAGGERPSGPRGETYVAVVGDNFWSISRKQYGSGRYYAALARHNQERIPDPQRLRPGMPVATPPLTRLEALYPELIDRSGAPSSPAAASVPEGRPRFDRPAAGGAETPRASRTKGDQGYFYGKSGQPLYRIGSDDTLSSIAQKHLGRASRWNEIFQQNRDVLRDPESLTPGTVLRLPVDASSVELPEEAVRRR